jgi:hypothetical protein
MKPLGDLGGYLGDLGEHCAIFSPGLPDGFLSNQKSQIG